ncbi:MAG: cation-transporting P-type ATPase [Deltaproteobacteria bacterium]|nr:cation-transporting P-type ATPase [Deltaproteobacteria bacterium]
MVQAIHTAIDGRARFKIAGLYGSEDIKRLINEGLTARDGITVVSVSTLTGNVLVLYNSGNTRQTVAALIKKIISGRAPAGRSVSHARVRAYKPEKQSKAPLISKGRLRNLVARAEEQRAEDWHLLKAEDALTIFSVSITSGLTAETAKDRLKKYGPNVLPEAVPHSGLSIFLNQLNSLPVALLGVAAGISVFTGGLADAILILGVVTVNATIGYLTESQAERTIHSLKSLVRPSALVLRDGTAKEMTTDEVVVGDILVLRPGSYIAADSRVITAHMLSVDESALTGESMPVNKTAEAMYKKDAPLADRTNMVFMGTLVTGGQGLAVAVATARFTEISRIQALVLSTEPPETPMQRQLGKMGTQLVLISGAVCGLVFVIGLLRGYGFLRMLQTSISLAVAAVPEGLPTVATTTLALGISNMRRHRVLIRHLDAVETLGSVQTICLDKTGTITLNRMTVVAVCAGTKEMRVTNGVFRTSGGVVDPFSCDELLRIIHVAALCNESVMTVKDGEFILNGSPTENALVHMAISAGIDVQILRERYPVVETRHRAENQNFMSTLHEFPDCNRLIAVKGSPMEVLSMCSFYLKDGKTLTLTEEIRLQSETSNERMAGEALRVLGAAYSIYEGHGDAGKRNGFIWLGLVGMADPVRKGVKESIRSFHSAGIDTVMITGDQSPTAYTIGKELDLSGNGHIEILDSTNLSSMEPGVLSALAERVHVFSRVSPANKLQIVQSIQRAGKVVAMTGDGINDSPALKAANIGIAMGHTGTDVAREVADVVLADDNIETMIIAVSQGRTIYNNIRKSVHFLLSTNLSEIMVMFTSIAGGLGTPLNAMQLLWINVMSDIAPGLALALEPPEPDVLAKPPRSPEEPIIKTSDFKRIFLESGVISAGSLAAYGYGIARYGIGRRAGTIAFMSLTTGQILHALSCRSEKPVLFGKDKLPPNNYLSAAVGISLALQVLALMVPGIRGILGITTIGVLDGLVAGAGAVVPLAVNELTKEGGGL